MKKVISFIVVACVSFSMSYIYWINSNQVNEYLSLTLYKPFVYRQLMPMLARSLIWLGVPANWAIVLTMTGAGIGFYYALRALILQFYEVNDLYIFVLFILGLSLFWLERLPVDWMTACLFSFAMLLLAQDKLLAYCLLFPIICLNRETAFLLAIFYLFYDHEIHMGRDIAIMLYQVFVWFGVRLGLMYTFRNNGGSDAWIMPLHNFQMFIAHPWHSLLHIAIAGGILWLVFKEWKSKPEFLRIAFVVFAPLLLIMYWIFGQAWEVRVLWEVYPVIAVLILPSLANKPMVILCDGGIPNL